jgi:uncharacterized protein
MHATDLKPEETTDPYMLMRVFIGESDKAQDGKYHGKPLWEALLRDFRERGLAGATVMRAIAGFGASAKLRTTLSEYLSLDLPIIIEVVDRESRIRAILPDLDEMIGGGMVTLEKAEIIIYRPAE